MEWKALHLHMNWERGILPVQGGLDDQAASYSAVVTATETGVKAGRSRQQALQAKQAERNNRGKGSPSKGPSRTPR